MDLPDELALPLTSGASWWYWLGGRPSMDFVNTLRERWWRRVETLVTPDELVLWLERAELLPAESGAARPSEALLRSARELREAIDACVVALSAGETAPADAVRTIDGWLAVGAERQSLARGTDGLPLLAPAPPADPVRHALGAIALDAARMLGTGERSRARICASDTCSARFYDRSPTAGRVWCSMRGCGNVAKARRHRERAREAPQ